MASRSWTAALTQAGQLEANYGRWIFPVIPPKMPNMPHNWFVTSQKEESRILRTALETQKNQV